MLKFTKLLLGSLQRSILGRAGPGVKTDLSSEVDEWGGEAGD